MSMFCYTALHLSFVMMLQSTDVLRTGVVIASQSEESTMDASLRFAPFSMTVHLQDTGA